MEHETNGIKHISIGTSNTHTRTEHKTHTLNCSKCSQLLAECALPWVRAVELTKWSRVNTRVFAQDAAKQRLQRRSESRMGLLRARGQEGLDGGGVCRGRASTWVCLSICLTVLSVCQLAWFLVSLSPSHPVNVSLACLLLSRLSMSHLHISLHLVCQSLCTECFRTIHPFYVWNEELRARA